MADENDRRTRRLGVAQERLGARAHLRHRSRRRLRHVGVHRLYRIDDDQRRAGACRAGGENILDLSCGGQLHRRIGEIEPGRAQAHLGDGLLARNIDDARASARQSRAGLDEQSGFANARLAAEQQHRARHEAAAGDTVEFVDACRNSWRRPAFASQPLEFEDAAARGAAGNGGRAGLRLFNEAVPLAAGVAATLPPRRDGAAVLTDVDRAAFGHVCLAHDAPTLVKRVSAPAGASVTRRRLFSRA